MHAWGLLMAGLIMSSHINIGIAGRTYALHQEQIHQQQQSQRQKTNDISEYRSLQYLQQPATDRQADSSLISTVIELGLKYGPTLFNLAFGGEGGSTPDKGTDKVDNLEIKEEDPLSTSNLISMAIKVALALFSSATSSGGIDKSDVNTTQSILGIIISALTGSENPSEVAVMAKQASEVVNMLISLVEALQTSFSSS